MAKHDIRMGLMHARLAADHFWNHSKDYAGTRAAVATKKYSDKIEWCLNDFITMPGLRDFVEELKRDMEDALVFTSVLEILLEASPAQRVQIEEVLKVWLKQQQELNKVWPEIAK